VHEVDVLKVGATRAIDSTELPRRRRLGGTSLRAGGRRLVRGVQDVRGVGQFCRAGPRPAPGPEDLPKCGVGRCLRGGSATTSQSGSAVRRSPIARPQWLQGPPTTACLR